MSFHLLYETTLGRTRASLFDESGRLLMLRQDDPSRPLIEGAVVWGRIRTVNQGMGSAFVDIGDTRDGILPLATLSSGSKKLTQGQPILVRVTRGGFGEKGPKLDARVAQLPPPADTPTPKLIKPALPSITRALYDANSTPVTVWLANPSALEDAKKHVSGKNIRLLSDPDSPPLLDFLDDALDTILSPKPTFTFSSGNLIVEITSAVATIDVNSALTTKGMSRAEAILATNLKAAEEIARISRLLDLGGSIIIDFITPPTKSHRQIVTEHLQASFAAADEGDVEIRPMSRHGLVELNRTRTGPSLNLLQAQPDYVAARILFTLWRKTEDTPQGRGPRRYGKTILCHPSVAQVLKPMLKESLCLIALGQSVDITEEELLQPTAFKIRDKSE